MKATIPSNPSWHEVDRELAAPPIPVFHIGYENNCASVSLMSYDGSFWEQHTVI